MNVTRAAAPFLLTALLASVSAATPDAPLKAGKLTAEFKPADGLTLSYNGAPVIAGCHLQLAAKDPKQSFSSIGGNAPVVRTRTLPGGGYEVTATYRDREGDLLDAEVQVEIRPDNTATLRLTATWRGAEPAALDWCAARLAAEPLAGATWRAEGVDYTDTNGNLPAEAKSPDARASLVTEKFWTLTLASKSYSLRAAPSQQSPDAQLLDARKYPTEWPKKTPAFWLGFTALPLPANGTVTRAVRLVFSPGKP